MKRIVAAPTAGSCGVLPAVLLPLARAGEADEEAICDALYVAAGFGQVIAARATLAGAEGGCQAEVGAASAMAAGALRHSHANWALSITGIAGPAGGSLEKPVGSVCFGWVGPDGRVEVESCFFPGSREEIRSQSVAHALTGLLERASVLSA